MARRTTTALMLALALALTGCGGGDDDTATDVAGAEATASSAAADPAAPAEDAAAFTGAEVCAFLEDELVPALDPIDDEISAQAQTVGRLSSFFEAHGGLEGADAYAVDDLAAEDCPDAHQKVLTKIGRDGIGGL